MALRKGEKGILLVLLVIVGGTMAWRAATLDKVESDKGIPYYTTFSEAMLQKAGHLYRRESCSDCHSLWTTRSIMQHVPAPPLDGIGSLRDEQWFYNYFSAADPQAIIPSRLKPEFRMPSYAKLSEADRHLLAQYMASLKVKDWYLEQTKKREYEKRTGKLYKPDE